MREGDSYGSDDGQPVFNVEALEDDAHGVAAQSGSDDAEYEKRNENGRQLRPAVVVCHGESGLIMMLSTSSRRETGRHKRRTASRKTS